MRKVLLLSLLSSSLGGPSRIVPIEDAILAAATRHSLLPSDHGLKASLGTIEPNLTDLDPSHFILLDRQRGSSVQGM